MIKAQINQHVAEDESRALRHLFVTLFKSSHLKNTKQKSNPGSVQLNLHKTDILTILPRITIETI